MQRCCACQLQKLTPVCCHVHFCQVDKLYTLQDKGREVKITPCVATRWGSVFDMFERLLRLRPALISFYKTLPHNETAIFNKQFQDWEELAQVVAVLRTFNVLQTQLQRRDLCMGEAWMGVLSAYLCLFQPFNVQDLRHGAAATDTVQMEVQDLCVVAHSVYKRLKEEIEVRFIMPTLPSTVLAAIFLDPLAGHTVLTQLSAIKQVSKSDSQFHNHFCILQFM
jgi:hypothetical protein